MSHCLNCDPKVKHPSNVLVKVYPCTHTEKHTDCQGRQHAHSSAHSLALERSHGDRQTHTKADTHILEVAPRRLKMFHSTRAHTPTHTRAILPLDSFQHQGTVSLCKLLSDCLAWRSQRYTENGHDTDICFSFIAQIRQCSDVCRGFCGSLEF